MTTNTGRELKTVAESDYESTEELARRQGVKPIQSADELAIVPDPFETDEEHEAFLKDLYQSRREGLA